MIEVLAVLSAAPDTVQRQAARQLKERFAVVSTLGHRLWVLRLPPHRLSELQALDGVQAVARGAAEAAGLAGLSDGEALFAAAWAAQGAKAGPRPGAGMDWDAPGFEPPGKPRR